MSFIGADFHFREGVAEVAPRKLVVSQGVGVIGINGDEGDVLGRVIGRDALDALFIILCGRAMIAREDDDQDFRVGEILERPVASIHARQVEPGAAPPVAAWAPGWPRER